MGGYSMKLRDILREIGEATAPPYRLDQSVREDDLDQYEFTTDTGNEYAILIEKETDGVETDYDVAFGVKTSPRDYDSENAFYPPLDTEKEVNDPKNLFRVMATVIAAVKRSIYGDELSGLRVTRVIMNPTKKDASDTRRTQLYKKYIEKHMPAGSKVYTNPNGSRIQVELPNK